MSAKEVFRKLGLWLAKSLFVMLIIAAIMISGVSKITDSSFLKPVLGEVITLQAQNIPLDEQYQGFIQMCNIQKTEIQSIPFNSDLGNLTLTINCTALKQNGKSELIDIFSSQVVNKAFDNSYNKKVCSGYDCLKMLQNLQNPLDLVTKDFNDFMKSQAFMLIGLSVLFGIFVLLLAKGWPAKVASLGSSLFTAGLPYFVFILVKSQLASLIPGGMGAQLSPFIDMIINPIMASFLWVLIAGAVLMVSGWIWKFSLRKKKK